MAMQEKVYFSDKEITVSNLRAAFNGVVYPINLVRGAVMREERPYRLFGTILCALAIGAGLFIMIVLQDANNTQANNFRMSCYLGFTAIFCLGMLIRYVPKTYVVMADLPQGRTKVLESKDPGYTLKACNAINSAMVNK